MIRNKMQDMFLKVTGSYIMKLQVKICALCKDHKQWLTANKTMGC
jgi:hypothetical protein